MFADSFTLIENSAARDILGRLNPQLDGAPFDVSMVRILGHALPFYPGYRLVEVSDHEENPPRRISLIHKEGAEENPVYILDGRNEIIHQLNRQAPLSLTQENVALYVRFFFTYVRGRFGRFIVVENVDDIDWREEPAPAGRKALGKMINPVTLRTVEENGTYRLSANIIFKDSLFESEISVSADGNVNLSNQELLVEDIPVLDDNFGQ